MARTVHLDEEDRKLLAETKQKLMKHPSLWRN